jgi:hypothetical protein
MNNKSKVRWNTEHHAKAMFYKKQANIGTKKHKNQLLYKYVKMLFFSSLCFVSAKYCPGLVISILHQNLLLLLLSSSSTASSSQN